VTQRRSLVLSAFDGEAHRNGRGIGAL